MGGWEAGRIEGRMVMRQEGKIVDFV